jgi:hypothetical protein
MAENNNNEMIWMGRAGTGRAAVFLSKKTLGFPPKSLLSDFWSITKFDVTYNTNLKAERHFWTDGPPLWSS